MSDSGRVQEATEGLEEVFPKFSTISMSRVRKTVKPSSEPFLVSGNLPQFTGKLHFINESQGTVALQ